MEGIKVGYFFYSLAKPLWLPFFHFYNKLVFINGAKDFQQWSPCDQELRKSVMIETHLGMLDAEVNRLHLHP